MAARQVDVTIVFLKSAEGVPILGTSIPKRSFAQMPGSGWPWRIAIAVLFVVIVLVAVGLGWARPGLFFYVATSIVGVLVWLDYEFNRKETSVDSDEDLIEPTVPDVHKDGPTA